MSSSAAYRDTSWASDIDHVLLSEEEIQEKVAELAARLREDYAGRQLLLVGVLKGAAVFLSDLMRHLSMPLCIDFVQLRSYGHATISSGQVEIVKDLEWSVEGWDVVVVEDIVDTGRTQDYLLRQLHMRGAGSVRICALLSKPSRRKVDVTIDYLGFDVPNVFVVGYGLDFAERYRNLPFVAVLRPEAYKTP
ncbi:MAG: hypoxanthine phosphoribosyltransferase [Armatimonadota bacterium]